MPNPRSRGRQAYSGTFGLVRLLSFYRKDSQAHQSPNLKSPSADGIRTISLSYTMIDPFTALQTASAVTVVIREICSRLNRLSSLNTALRAIPRLRNSLGGLEALLLRVQMVYNRSLEDIRAPREEFQWLYRCIEDCRQPCVEINEVLITILEKKRKTSQLEKLSRNMHVLEWLQQCIESSKVTLSIAMNTIR